MATQARKRTFNFFGDRLMLVLGVALLFVAAGLFLFPSTAKPDVPPPPVANPSDIVASGVTTSGYANRVITQEQNRLQQDPKSDTALSQLGLAYLQKARETNDPTFYVNADDALKKALAANPTSFEATAAMGSLALSRHLFQDALNWGIKARGIGPQKAYAYGVIADAQTEIGDYDQAVETLTSMVNLRPDLSSYSRISYARELHGDVDGAITAMKQAVEAGGPAPENSSWSHVQLGNLYFNSGKLDLAEAQYNSALAVFPGYLHAQAGLAQVRAAQGRSNEAVALYKQAIANVPLPQYVQALGDLYTSIGNAGEAKKQYDLVDYTYHVFDVNGVETGIEKAAFYADQGRSTDQAVKLAEDTAGRRHDIHTLDTLAWARYQAGRYSDALAAAQQALRLGTKSSLLLYHIGMIYNKLGDTANARKNLQAALDISPYFNVKYAPQTDALLKGMK
ncbi:MAG: tetratricopeptide repeat protein [Chloroflexia bacterium]